MNGELRSHRREKRSHKRQMRHSICMVSDFFLPNLGGVEMHIYSLAQCLMQRGHKVIVVTHAYADRAGVRYMTNGLKVYHIPVPILTDQAAWPTLFPLMPLIRDILIREQITIVHGHQVGGALREMMLFMAVLCGWEIVNSSRMIRCCVAEHLHAVERNNLVREGDGLPGECTRQLDVVPLLARTFEFTLRFCVLDCLQTVYTDHSLFGFADVGRCVCNGKMLPLAS
jgi:hypothetical protein